MTPTILRRLLPPISLALALAACADRTEKVDADLTRDLQLANQAPANPQFQDVPLGTAPAPRSAGTKTAQPTPTETSPAPQRRTVSASETSRAPAPPPVREERQPAADQPVRSSRRGIVAGTSFGLVTRGQVCTSNLPGDKIVAVTTNAVTGENGATIPEGTSVVLEVTSVTPADKPEDAQIGLRVRSIVINGESVSMEGSVVPTSGLERGQSTENGADKKKVIGGAIAGAMIGQVLGKDTRSTVIGAAAGAAAGTAAAAATRKYHACLPAGGSVRVTTTQPIALD